MEENAAKTKKNEEGRNKAGETSRERREWRNDGFKTAQKKGGENTVTKMGRSGKKKKMEYVERRERGRNNDE